MNARYRTRSRSPVRRSGGHVTHAPLFCPACDRDVEAWAPGPGGRPEAACPHCGSLERHRFLAYAVRSLPDQIGEVRHILDLAPHRQVRGVLEVTFPGARYVGTDLFEPGRAIDLLADITRLPIATDSVDLLICYHVLEHVPDDRAAMGELARVLVPEGLGLLQVPFRPTAQTDEDPSLPPDQRAERFGQEDHVRWYGGDFEDRLRAAGLELVRFEPTEALAPDDLAVLGGSQTEPVWFVGPQGAARPAPTIPNLAEWRQVQAQHDRVMPTPGPDDLLDRARAGLKGLLRGR